MKIEDSYRDVLVPANVAVTQIRLAGLPVDLEQIRKQREEWERDLVVYEKVVEDAAAEVGVTLKYSDKHSVDPKTLSDVYSKLKLFPKNDLAVERAYTAKGKLSTSEEALMEYASLSVPWTKESPGPNGEVDNPVVRAALLVRSVSKGFGTYLNSFERTCRADGCCHPKFNWALRTARLSAEDPPVHQIPERSHKEVADKVKACIVPRRSPYRVQSWNTDAKKGPLDFGGWDPRKHGFCFRWDISGAEAAIRAAMLTHLYGCTDPIAWEYIRLGKDIHGKTASMIYDKPDGTFRKGQYERDVVGKQTFFAKIFGATSNTVRQRIWEMARVLIPETEAEKISNNFDLGYAGLTQLYEIDQYLLSRGYCVDAYGRRRAVPIPEGVTFIPSGTGNPEHPGGKYWDVHNWRSSAKFHLANAFHIMANTPTQSTNAWDNLWMLALCYHGEYVELRVPPMWEKDGVPFPEAKGWALHGGPGPGGRPFEAWHNNTVHDSGWGDGAPGWMEPTAKLIWRRCRAVPLDWRLQADVPYRVDLTVGPDMGHLADYNLVAREFSMEPVPQR